MADDGKSGSLGFFSSYDDLSDSSDSDEEAETQRKTTQRTGTEAPGGEGHSSELENKRTASGAPLPKPDELFNSVKKPTFLYNPLNKQIDWDNLAVKAPEEVNTRTDCLDSDRWNDARRHLDGDPLSFARTWPHTGSSSFCRFCFTCIWKCHTCKCTSLLCINSSCSPTTKQTQVYSSAPTTSKRK